MIEPLTTPIVGFSHATDFAWPLVLMQDVCKLNYGKALKSESRVRGPVPVYGSNGQTGWHSQALCTGPTVVLGRKGQGNLGVEWVEGPLWVIDTAYYVTFEQRMDPRYFYYFVDFVGLNHLKDGTSNPSLSRDVFNVQPIPLPPTDVQEGISNVLSTFDDKIDLNRRMNETLEAMAQAIFRDWFVDFGPVRRKLAGETDPVAIMGGLTPDPARAAELAALFPAALNLGGLPEGWRDSSLGQEFDVRIGKTPPRKETEHFLGPNVGLPWCSIRDLAGGEVFASATNETLRPESVAAFRVSKLPEMTVIVSFKLTVGRVAISDCEMTTNEAIAHMIRRADSPSAWFTFCHLRQFDYGTLGSTSSIATAVNSATIRAVPIKRADPAVHEAFDLIVGPLFQRLRAAARENRTLAETRDYLLPRLMSGEVRVAPSNSGSAAA